MCTQGPAQPAAKARSDPVLTAEVFGFGVRNTAQTNRKGGSHA